LDYFAKIVICWFDFMACFLVYCIHTRRSYRQLTGSIHFSRGFAIPIRGLSMIISYVLNPVVSLLNKNECSRTIAVLLIYSLLALNNCYSNEFDPDIYETASGIE